VISYGNIKIDIPHAQLENIRYEDYFQCYQQYDKIEKYYTKHNSSIWQMFEESPDWVHNLATKLPQDFDHHVVSTIKVEPGQTIPHHVDKHFKLKQEHGDGISHRYLIFLEDWKRGHYYEVHDQPFTKWRKGDWVKFGIDDWHLAGNMGDEPFYSAQVTVLKNV
tara:strand:+ start:8941 stop:9432 length:492 start_codon:yes stop_codon:yes gene_type:complete